MTLTRALPAALALTMMAACASSGTTATTSGRPASGEGRFVWQDLVTTDAAAARTFYSGILGWEFAQTTRAGRPYSIARTAAGPVGGIVDVRDIKDAASQWVSYVAVDDLDRTIDQVRSGGGRIIVPPTSTGVGRVSVVGDPQGAALGLLKPSKEPPSDPAKPAAGHFFWREYLARDRNRALEFYKGLLRYDAANTDAQLGVEYFVLRRDVARAGLFQIPAGTANVRPHWLPYVLVDNPAAVATKATTLGGRVLLEPSANRRNGTLAIVADPTGGVVALQKFPM
jgi:predicted enzyme related to lactoylglutathione lyase